MQRRAISPNPHILQKILAVNQRIIDNGYHCYIDFHYKMTLMDTCAELEFSKDNTPRPLSNDRRIDSETLLGQEGRVVIEHGEQQYLLRQTQAGKLILTK